MRGLATVVLVWVWFTSFLIAGLLIATGAEGASRSSGGLLVFAAIASVPVLIGTVAAAGLGVMATIDRGNEALLKELQYLSATAKLDREDKLREIAARAVAGSSAHPV